MLCLLQRQIKFFEERIGDKPICNTCQCEIQEYPSRVLSIADKSGNPIVLHFHYFFPCWDLALFCQEYPHHRIVAAGYTCQCTVLQKPKQVRSLKQNFDLWD